MRVFLATLGCRLNEAELEGWSRGFESRGHPVVKSPTDANVIVVNTCAVTGEAARKSRKFIGGLHRNNPSAPIVVSGCYSQLQPDEAAELAGVDLVVGNTDKEQLVQRVLDEVTVESMPRLATAPESTHVYREARTRAFIKVQDGCRNRCTFCIVTIARGNERSRPIPELIDELNQLSAAGYQEAVLTGVHLGGYGSDLDGDLRELVEAVLRNTDIPRIRLSSLEPWDLPSGFETLWQNPRLMPHLHLPLQSGDDAVLKRMARRCSTDEYRRLVDSFRQTIPDLTLTTDIIVGFPGESDDEWRNNVEFVRSIGFGHIHVFSYSARAGTTAARMPGHLPRTVKSARSRELHQVASDAKAHHLARFAGTTRPVLWEGGGEALPGGERRFVGYTDNYLRVSTTVAEGVDLENRIASARLGPAVDGVIQATHIL